MTYADYLESCLNFSRDTQEWLGLDEKKFYTTDTTSTGWSESCDNAGGGIDVSWAFRLNNDEVIQAAPGMYARNIIALVHSMIDNQVDYDTMWDVLHKFED